MKIAINTLGPSKMKAGIGNYVVNLVNELQKIDAENEYLIFTGRENDKFFTRSKNFKFINVELWNKNKLLRIFWEQLILPFKLWKRVDVLHSPGFVSPILKTTKQIVTIHDMTFFTHPEFHLKSKVQYFKNTIPISAKKADVISADSENTKREIVQILKIDPNKIKTVHLGTNFKHQKNAKRYIKQKYKIKKPFILFAGMLEPRKNIPNLIKSFAKLPSKFKQQLVIVGKKGWMYGEIFELIKELNLKERIIFTGYVSDQNLEYFYSAADLFVYPSYYEGFGIPVIEAMACGCPVITSNNSSLKEIAGSAALLINNPENINEISEKMQKLLINKQLRQKLIQKGLAQAKEFSWKNTAEKTLELYHSVQKITHSSRKEKNDLKA